MERKYITLEPLVPNNDSNEQTPPTPLTAEKGFEETFNQQNQESGEKNKEQVEKQRQEVKESLDKSLNFLKEFLAKNADKLSAEERARIAHAIITADNAKQDSLDKGLDKYEAKIIDSQGNKVRSREEGIPVDGLTEALQLIQNFQVESKKDAELVNTKHREAGELLNYLQQLENLKGQGASIANPDNLGSFISQNTPELRQDLLDLVGQWLKADQQPDGVNHDKLTDKDVGYEFNFYLFQVGQAARQLQGKYQQQIEGNRDLSITLAPEEISHLRETIKANSKDYFESLYNKKHGVGMDKQESDDQHAFTEREALFIDKDAELRQILLDKFQGQIEGFDKLSRIEQNYQLAMLSLREREVLEMPKLDGKDIPDEAPVPVLVTPEDGNETGVTPKALERILLINIDEIADSMAWRKAEQKLHVFYDNSKWLSFRRMGKSFTYEWRKLKFYQEALDEIKSNNNLLDAMRGRLQGQRNGASVNPELKDYFELLDDVLEQYENNLAKNSESGDAIQQTQEVSDLVAKMVAAHASGDVREWARLGPEYADPSMDERARVELFVKNAIVPKMGAGAKWDEKDTSKQNEQSLYASNFWQIAENYKDKQEQVKSKYLKDIEGENLTPEQQEQLEKLLGEHMAGLGKLDIQLGAKERDLYNNKPKGILAFYEKAMQFTQNSKVLSAVINPVTVGLGAAVAFRLGQTAVKGAGVAAVGAAGVFLSPFAPLIIGAGVAGGWRFLKANKDLKFDLARDRRNEALGGDKSELLDKKGGIRYTTLGYGEAQGFLQSIDGKDFNSLSNDERQMLGNIQAMRNIEKSDNNRDERRVDLFVADSDEGARKGSVIGLRNKLDIALRQWEPQLGNISGVERSILRDVNAVDKDEQSFRLLRSTYAGVGGAVIGTGAGLIIPEGFYIGGRHLGLIDGNRSSALENLIDQGTGTADHGAWNDLLGRAQHMTTDGENYAFYDPETGQKFSAEEAAALQTQAGGGFKLEDLRREDWHGVGRNFQGKELQQWHTWNKDKDSVAIDVHRMMNNVHQNVLNHNTTNWDGTHDPKMTELLKEVSAHDKDGTLTDRMQVRIFPTGDDYNNGQGISVGHVDESGKLVLSDEMRKYAFDASGHQNARAIEVGYMDDKGEFHTLNTAVGDGDMEGPSPPSHPLEPMTPAVYDIALSFVPPSRKVWGRYGDEKEKPGNEEKPRDNKGDGIVNKTALGFKEGAIAGLAGAQSIREMRQVNNKMEARAGSPKAAAIELVRSMQEAGLSTKEVAGNKEIEFNPFDSYLSKEPADLIGPDWKKLLESIPREQLANMKERAKKVKIDFPSTTKLIKDINFQNQMVYLLRDAPQSTIDMVKSIDIVGGERKPIRIPGVLVLTSARDKEGWKDDMRGYVRRVVNDRAENSNTKVEDESIKEDTNNEANEEESTERPNWVVNTQAWGDLTDPKKGLIKVGLDEHGLKPKLSDNLLELLDNSSPADANAKYEKIFKKLHGLEIRANTRDRDYFRRLIETVEQLDQQPGEGDTVIPEYSKKARVKAKAERKEEVNPSPEKNTETKKSKTKKKVK